MGGYGVGYSFAAGRRTGSSATPDVTAPAIPTNLTLTSNDSEIAITWMDPPDTDLANVIVYRSLSANGTYTPLVQVPAGVRTITNSPLTNGTTYWYKVLAIDVSGNKSAMSLAKSATPTTPLAAPTTPANDTYIIAGNASASVHYRSRPAGAATAVIERKTTGGYSTVGTPSAAIGMFTDTGLTNGTTYTYRVTWRNSAGDGPAGTGKIAVPWNEWKPLRGNESFAVTDLHAASRVWYDRITPYFVTPSSIYEYGKNPKGLYDLGRFFCRPIIGAVTMLRLTGDLRFLDMLDYGMQLARTNLADQGAAGSGDDGYVNWLWLVDPSASAYYNKDTHVMDESMTHGVVSVAAWAYAQNRDLASPGGVNYGERADFWLDYLQNTFEAKWRARNSVPTAANWLDANGLTHPELRWGLGFNWNYWRLTGDARYRTVADAKYDDHRQDVMTIDSDKDIWPLGMMYENSFSGFPYTDLHNTGYVQYVALDVFNAFLEGNPKIMEANLTRFANSIATYILDNGVTDVSESIGGDTARGGYAANGEGRNTAGQYFISTNHYLSHWDATGRMQQLAERFYDAQNSILASPNASMAMIAAYQLGDLPVAWGLTANQSGSDTALTWTLPANGGYTAWDHVVVYEGTTSGSLTQLAELSATTTTYTHTAPSTGTHYYAVAIRSGATTGTKTAESSAAIGSSIILALDLPADNQSVGTYGAGFASYDSGGVARFIGDGDRVCYRYALAVPRSATIASATLTLESGATNPAVSVDIYAVKSDDAAAPTNAATVNANVSNLTAAKVTWAIPSTPGGTERTSPNLKTVFQEIVGRAGWVNGNHVLLYAVPTPAGPAAEAQMKTIAGGFAPHVTLEYS